ncbi:MAG TPA: hypothetical protein V6D19_15155, partial [Stenomitos sp.]
MTAPERSFLQSLLQSRQNFPPMKLTTVIVSLLIATSAHAGHFTGTTASDNDQSLTISTGDHSFPAPRTEPEQTGFRNPRVSSDGGLAGWLALQPNCCTSY